jgi:PAS domain S-box-containing protein
MNSDEPEDILSQIDFKKVVEHVETIVLFLDPEGRMVYLNAFALDFFGYEKEKIIGRHAIGTIVPVTDSAGTDLNQMITHMLTRPNEYSQHENENIRKDGSRVWIKWSNRAVSVDGSSVAIACVGTDISNMKERERELVKLGLAVRQSPISIVITDRKGKIEYVNPKFEELTGYTRSEAVGENPGILSSGDYPDGFYEQLWETISSGRPWHGRFKNVKKNGDEYYEEAVIAPVTDENGEITNYIGLKQDITRQHELEAVKEDVDRIMRHDLKTPLNAIIGIPQLMKETMDLETAAVDLLDKIETAGNTMLNLINVSLDLYKMETGTYRYQPIEFDLLKVVSRVENDTSILYTTKRQEVRISVNGSVPNAGTRVQFRGEELITYSMLSNLLLNAIEAAPEESRIGIELSTNPILEITIRNKGAVPESIRSMFFQKYTTYGKRHGTGLGTYSARLMAETMGGRITMETDDVEGTAVTISFPVERSTDSDRSDGDFLR